MLSKNDAKILRKLQRKKYRDQNELFVAEGPKVIGDLINNGLTINKIWSSNPQDVFKDALPISEVELKSISNFEKPNQSIALFNKPKLPPLFENLGSIVLLLDGIRDPGNLGTLIRLADWFGVSSVFCSPDCVDAFNPKTVQSSMGSLGNVSVFYEDLKAVASTLKQKNYPIFGTHLKGDNIYQTEFPEKYVLVMGSESHGISSDLDSVIDAKITIPKSETGKAESLNVAIAASIFLGVSSSKKLS